MTTMTKAQLFRKAMLERAAKKSGTSTGRSEQLYRHWDLPTNGSATIRLLPDAVPTNPLFWVEYKSIKMPFSGIKNGPNKTDDPVYVTVPCLQTWGEHCEITEAIKEWWKDDDKAATARIYWRKPIYYFNGLVVSSTNPEETPPSNPIRTFGFTKSIFEIIEQFAMDDEIEDLACDYDHGRDFTIRKSSKGGFANYSTSQFSMKERKLSTAERDAIDTHGLVNLSTLLPKKPEDNATLDAIIELFCASRDGLAFDHEMYGEFYRPYVPKTTAV